ncbi:MAG: multidrug transporter AcrB [Rhodobacterales bacterium]|nr:MAG: multidrug transporter AcrB [Rhodobacterales bacterium]
MSNKPEQTEKLGLAGFLTRSFIASPLTPLLLITAFAVGFIALLSLPREEEPQISVPLVDIHVQAPGLKAEDAVKLITEPLENMVKGIDQVEHVYSSTSDNQAMVTARFIVGVPSETAILRVHDKIRANMDRIPVGIPEPLVIGRGINDVAIVALTFAPAPGQGAMNANDLTRIVREVEAELAKIDDVGLTYIVGETTEALRVAPDPEKLALYGVTLQQLVGKVQGANIATPAGTVRDQGEQAAFILGNTFSTPDEIGNLKLTARDGRSVYVRDVADVRFVTDMDEVHVASLSRDASGAVERMPAVTLAVAKRAGANAVNVAEHILHKVDSLKGSLIPDSIAVEVTRDYGETANEKANELLFHLGLATVSIVLLVLLSIGWREAIVVAVVIPVTILLTLFASWIMGYTLNRVSLFALIFSIGILVDDAIVVIENIARHWGMNKDGKSRIGAAITAVAEVGNPTIVATLTVVVALLPMLFVSGLMGPYMSPIPANASAAMIFSFFVAVMITPWLMIKIAGKAKLHHGADAETGGKLGKLYAVAARPILRSKLVSMLFLLIVVVTSFGSLGAIYTSDVTVKLLPFDNKSELNVVIDLPEGSSVEATDAVAQQAARIALGLEEVVSVQTYSGTASPFNFNGLVRHYFLRQRPELGDVQIKLHGKEHRNRTSHQIALELRELLAEMDVPPGTNIKTVEPPPGPPVIATLLAEIYGPDADTRRETARQIRQAFEAVPYVVDVDDSFGERPRRLRAQLSADDLEFYRVQERDALDTLRLLNSDVTVGYSHRGMGRQPIPIVVGRDRGDKVIDERLLATPVPANVLPGDRGVVELGDVVSIAPEQASLPIFRHNGRYAEMVMGEMAGQFEAPLYGMIAVGKELGKIDWQKLGVEKPEIILHGQPEDESKPALLWDGEWEVTWVTFRDMGAAFGVALLGIYILVVAQFGSFRLPLVVLTPVPLTFLGIMFGHWLFKAPFSATSMIGFIALAGIIVRNSILLVDFIRHEGDGKVDLDVLIAAGSTRFKPILLTALAAMIGAAVILTDPIFQGLAISLLFGLATSTLLTVLVIPAIYRVFKM